ncbi:MAG: serine/threonine protein kinase [Proteobacteria bacterium]|nr:serine/threonine protein kinase [Pseudomonadota bacterium]
MDVTEFSEREISQNYRVNSKLGSGGCSIVYDATRLSDARHVAIKVLSLPETLDHDEAIIARQRFCREALLMVTLHNPHIADCLDYGVYKNSPCIVLEFIEGKSLHKYLKEFGALPFDYSVDIICQLLDALSTAHASGIIHRDIKPGNILITGDDTHPSIHLIDFGIASMTEVGDTDRITKTGTIRGTPSYMAPELFSGLTPASVASDLYSVGLVLYECLTGKVAVTGFTVIEIGFKQTHQEISIPVFIPKCFAKVIQKSCAKSPDQRYQSAQEMCEALRAALPEAESQRDSCARAYMNSIRNDIYTEKPSKRKLIAIAAACLFVIGITVAVTLFVTRPSPSAPALEQAVVNTIPMIPADHPSSVETESEVNEHLEQAAVIPTEASGADSDAILHAPDSNSADAPEIAPDIHEEQVIAAVQPTFDEPSAALPKTRPNPALPRPPAPRAVRAKSTLKAAPEPPPTSEIPVDAKKEKLKKTRKSIPSNLI